jgi:hypothetical protein
MADPASAGATHELWKLVSTLWTARRDTARDNDLVLAEYEDLARWARDDAEAERTAIEDAGRGWREWGSPTLEEQEQRIRREFAVRWRNRKSQSGRTIRQLRYSENFIHWLYRAAFSPWPANPYADEIMLLTRRWEDMIRAEGL